jgi:serine/threonine protein kinase
VRGVLHSLTSDDASFSVRAGEKSKPALSWENRYKAALGIAEALSYVHSGGPRPVFHRDVKSSNILLTEEFEPQVQYYHPTPYTHG